MSTSDSIIRRLPTKPMLTCADISLAIGLLSSNSILDAIRRGDLSAVRVSSRYFVVSRDEAIRWIRARESQQEDLNG